MQVSSGAVHPSDVNLDHDRFGDDGFRAVAADRLEGVRPESNAGMDLVGTGVLEETAVFQ